MQPKTIDAALSGGVCARNLTKSFEHEVLSQVSLDLRPGEVLALTGPSGAGKTTLARILAGLERPDSGTLAFGGRDALPLTPGQRDVQLMFESYALYPHLSVVENTMSPLVAAHVRSGRKRDKARDATNRATTEAVLELLEIAHLGHRLPAELSGGQKQRVALARALVREGALLILDEPISHLDAKLRHKLRGELRQRISRRASPSLWITPDGVEALSVGDRVAVLSHGRIEQVGTPEEVWQRPANMAVARLLGDPAMNLIPLRRDAAAATPTLGMPGMSLALDDRLSALAARATGDRVVLGIRPDALDLAAHADMAEAHGEIYANEPFGKHAIVTVQLKGGQIVKAKGSMPWAAELGGGIGEGIGRPVRLKIRQEAALLFDHEDERNLGFLK
ncbi:ABC transporter ATP-binding protein [Salipiger bermudensis]|uniref:ABC transporter ATP-binding protein n=1 Tax=Salipiger bermudensis TaxID=344736 RepID=UPI0021BDCCE6|nr:ABC transporter ATP-binding protein [Salipiger bermudensis]